MFFQITSVYVLLNCFIRHNEAVLPIVVNTWPFVNATTAAWNALAKGLSAEESLVIGCTACEVLQCDGTVGYGGSPDESGETTLDAMIMDGATYAVGAVGDLRRVKNAIGVAQAVMHYTEHTFLAGESATKFAIEMGFKEESLATNKSQSMYTSWKLNKCQPNFRQNVMPDPKSSCGPYSPIRYRTSPKEKYQYSRKPHKEIDTNNHDTIGMVVIDKHGHVWAGTSTNGANHKIPGRIGDSPIMGSGAYASNLGGGAAGTGDGDIMMRFLPSFRAVIEMERGLSPEEAARVAMAPIIQFYPSFSGALVAVNTSGNHGAFCHGFQNFGYSIASPEFSTVQVINIDCTHS
ncbi:N(4)-(Beta-N-acetylglucosaminyl)-L-asparaginase-like [Physella acuta]|uniref:N(4)-(Beta-N-acetylglucosaminyl)-L-asparaginase- like n=1 Tax=Physella acuta TaxID=109671 RepID=UPI0027DDEEE4|nr:N(4)-(Beta-N-acetylglucosaminyl)-L-asparaginase-like [Physella acuta]